MCALIKKQPLLLLLFVLLYVTGTLQNPVMQNYTEDLLRHAKAAEILSFYYEDYYDTCGNFYKQACGNWKLTHPATYAKPRTAYLERFESLYKKKCMDMLKSASDNDRQLHKMLKNFYAACTNETAVAKEGLAAVIKVADFKGGWPRVTAPAWYETEYDWLKTIAEMRSKLGVDIFIGLELADDLEGNNQKYFKVGAPKLDFDGSQDFLSKEYAMEREEYVRNIANKLNQHFTDMPANWAIEVAQQVLDVEQKLAKGLTYDPRIHLKNITHVATIADLKTAYGNFVDINRYFTIIFNETIYEKLYERPYGYLTNLVKVIRETPKLTIANYTMWRILERVDFAGMVNEPDNDGWCLKRVFNYFPKELEQMFEENYEYVQFGYKIEDIFNYIKDTFRQDLMQSPKFNWMTEQTRQRAVSKLEVMSVKLENHFYNTLMTEANEVQYALKNNTYFENLLLILQWQTKRALIQMRQKLEIPAAATATIATLPKYELTKNQILIPVAFMQARILWDPIYPNAIKYGTIGTLLAQQMLRAFIGLGREYDKNGYPNKLWDNATETAYKLHEDCFVKQYENYKFQGKDVHDDEAVLKAITDAGALGIAYQAYHRWMNSAAAELLGKESLPRINFKPYQLFFLTYAQMWCADYHQSFDQFTQLPERLRANGPILNSFVFSNEFDCEVNTNMNPKKKCELF